MPLPPRWQQLAQNGMVMVQAIIRTAMLQACADFESGPNPRAALAAEVARLNEQRAIYEEAARILCARLQAIPAHQRPHYAPTERLAILALRARAGWNATTTARTFLLSAGTVATWTSRLREHGAAALLSTPVPVSRFPDFVGIIVRQLKTQFALLGRRKLAEVLARVGLHLSASTVRRMLHKRTPPPVPGVAGRVASSNNTNPPTPAATRVVRSKRPHHLWHVDITLVPTTFGFWVPWFPNTISPRWPFCWHVVAVLDHLSRAVVAKAAFRQEPTAANVCSLLDAAVRAARAPPKHMVTDRGAQFQDDYRAWCKRHGVKPRFGAIGKHGSIAIIERFFRTMKTECFRRILVPLNPAKMDAVLNEYAAWYNLHRPHATLRGATPDEVLRKRMPACQRQRIEMRQRYPIRGPPKRTRLKGSLTLAVSHLESLPHLPIVRLNRAA